jgi:MFS family permease
MQHRKTGKSLLVELVISPCLENQVMGHFTSKGSQVRSVGYGEVRVPPRHASDVSMIKSSFFHGNYRWVICGLLFFATTFNYLDRQVISYLKEFFCTSVDGGGFGWTNSDYANVTTVFTAFYATMTIFAGMIIDKIGTKLGLALAFTTWSFFGIANAFVGNWTVAHMAVRSLFGVGEAGNFPASIKTVAEWFPKRERALATGIFNSGSNVGAMIAALFVPWCLIHFGDQLGWKMAFIITGAVGLPWLIVWFWLYDPPSLQKRLSKEEFDYIHSDHEETKAQELSDDKSGQKISVSLLSFSGRISRATFVGITFMTLFLCLFVYFISTMFPSLGRAHATMVYRVCGFLALLVNIVAQSRRWHDLGKSGWLVFLNLIPGIGTLGSILYLSSRNGQQAVNRFGAAATTGILGHLQTWAFFFGKFLTDGIWWFYLFWLPDYLLKQFHMTKHEVMLPTFIVYGVAIIGSIGGGSIPMALMNWGMPAYRARMTAMFLIALVPLTVLSTQYFANVARFGQMASWYAVAVICLGAAAHQAWSANLFSTVSDMFPKKMVGSVTGIGAMGGGLGGVIILKLSGMLTDTYKADPSRAYFFMFVLCSLSYLAAWSIMKLLVPRHKLVTTM